MKTPNSLLNMSKQQLADQHARLVEALMALWGMDHIMESWLDPLSAVQQLIQEHSARRPNGEGTGLRSLGPQFESARADQV